MKMQWLAGLLGSKWKAPRVGGSETKGQIGGYCHGKSLEECRRTFGDRLAKICSTCPD